MGKCICVLFHKQYKGHCKQTTAVLKFNKLFRKYYVGLYYRDIPTLHLASLVFSDEDIPGSEVSVDEGLTAEVVHTPGHLHTELSQQSCRV